MEWATIAACFALLRNSFLLYLISLESIGASSHQQLIFTTTTTTKIIVAPKLIRWWIVTNIMLFTVGRIKMMKAMRLRYLWNLSDLLIFLNINQSIGVH